MTDDQHAAPTDPTSPADAAPAVAAAQAMTQAATEPGQPATAPEEAPTDREQAAAEQAAAEQAAAEQGGPPVGEADGEELPEEEEPDPEQRAAEDGRTPGQLLEALEAAQGERDDYLDALQRSRAEFDNFRRRSAREAAGARSAGMGDLAQQLLDVLDDLDRTVDVAERSSDEGLAAGIQAIHRKLVDVLLAAGVERIDEVGVPFDATRHEAVQQVPAEEPVDEPEVAQVLRPGYLHAGRCLRPAMVSVRQ